MTIAIFIVDRKVNRTRKEKRPSFYLFYFSVSPPTQNLKILLADVGRPETSIEYQIETDELRSMSDSNSPKKLDRYDFTRNQN